MLFPGIVIIPVESGIAQTIGGISAGAGNVIEDAPHYGYLLSLIGCGIIPKSPTIGA